MKILISPFSDRLPDNDETRESWSVDQILLYQKDISSDLIDSIINLIHDEATLYVPTVLDVTNALSYDGADFALQLLMKAISCDICRIQIYLMGIENQSMFMLKYKYPNILKLPNIKYVYFNKYEVRRFDEAFDCIPTHQEYINMLDALGIQLPSSFHTTHSVTNEWCTYKWSSFLNINKGGSFDLPQALYFDYLKTKFHLSEDRFERKAERIFDKVKALPESKILVVDDNCRWHRFFTEFFADTKIEVKCIGSDFKRKDVDMIVAEVNNIIDSFAPNVILLDYRLIEDADYSNQKDVSGVTVLRKLKGTADKPGCCFGRQIIMFTATSRIENILRLKRFYADGFILKEKPLEYIGKKTSDEVLSSAIQTISDAINRAKFLVPLNVRLSTLSGLTEYVGQETREEINKVANSVRTITQGNELTKNVLKLVCLDIFGLIEAISRDRSIVKTNSEEGRIEVIPYPKAESIIVSDGTRCTISRPEAEGPNRWNLKVCDKVDNWIKNKEQSRIDLNVVIIALILFRANKKCIDETKWNQIRCLRNKIVHNSKELGIGELQRLSLDMLTLLEDVIVPKRANQ